ncbi:MAG: uracil-DNA glycosylase [Proteobacteria bacterium]|nr:uracil-DNA glycosylase [Pseudomonadota bacterium]
MTGEGEPLDSGRARELFRAFAGEVRRHLAALSADGFPGWDVGKTTLETLGDWTRPLPRAGAKPPAAPPPGESLENVIQELSARKGCGNCPASGLAVPGEGNPRTRLVFVAGVPGLEEDGTARPVAGAPDRLLTDVIEKGMNTPRAGVYVTTAVKCRPPENRAPAAGEIRQCQGWLWREIRAVGGRFVCTLGEEAARAVLETDQPLTRLRGKIHEVRGVEVMCTHHPAALLTHPEKKGETWKDIQILMARMNRDS